MTRKSIIVAVVGLAGSGKSTVVNIIRKLHPAPIVYFGGSVISEVKKRGLAVTEATERAVREQMRDHEGMGVMAVRAIPEIEAALKESDLVILDGLYSGEEARVLKDRFPDHVLVVAVHARRALREQRVGSRAVRPLSASELNGRDLREVKVLDKATPIALADFHLVNDGSEGDLTNKVQDFLRLNDLDTESKPQMTGGHGYPFASGRVSGIAIEGLEGSGKTSVGAALAARLIEHGRHVAVIPEFSDSLLGEFLFNRLQRDLFLRDPEGRDSSITELLTVAADTSHALEYSIPDAGRQGRFVVKDRYRESVVACQSLSLAERRGLTPDQAYCTARGVALTLPDTVEHLIWLDADVEHRTQRLATRGDYRASDMYVYRFREEMYRRLRLDPAWAWRAIDIDANRPIQEMVDEILSLLGIAG